MGKKRDRTKRRTRHVVTERILAAGLAVGLVVAIAWKVTEWKAYDYPEWIAWHLWDMGLEFPGPWSFLQDATAADVRRCIALG